MAYNICPEVGFVAAGLRAAQNSKMMVRENVVEDVSLALNCSPSALGFLFADCDEDADNLSDSFDLPDAERRRQIILHNHLEAAE